MLEVQKYKLIWDELVIQKGGLGQVKMQKKMDEKFNKANFDNFA